MNIQFEEPDEEHIDLVVRIRWRKADLWSQLAYFFRRDPRPVSQYIDNTQSRLTRGTPDEPTD